MLRPTTLLRTAALLSFAAIASAQGVLTPLPGFGTNGWLAPGSSAFNTTGNTERGLAYNPVTGNLVLASRAGGNHVRVLSGATGADLGGFDTTGVTGGTFALNMIGVADDGAIYACNLSTSAAAAFKVYKWDSEALGPVTPPSVAFNAVTGVLRTGDAFAVTGGTGVNPAIFAGAGSTAAGTPSNFVVGSLDTLNTVTAYTAIAGTTATNNDYRLSLAFVDQTTLIGNQGGTARMTVFDPVQATLTASVPLIGTTRRALDYTVVGTTPLLAVIDSVTAQVTVLDLTVPTAPVAIAAANATVGTLTANTNGTGSVAWGQVTGNSAVLYALGSNHGVQAFTFTLGTPASVNLYGTGCDGLAAATNGLPTLGNATFEVQVTNVPVISPIAFVAFGGGAVNPGVDLSIIGMPGCFGYTTFDIGMFGTGPVVGGVGAFPLPIPASSAFAGATLAAQGLSLTLTTSLGLASSNGVQLVLGL
jgi:hypothetical protein